MIEPVPEGIHRPLWSVMIPVYNGTKYLGQALRSVLEQAPGVDEMQIDVIDDCSTEDDPERVVREVGGGRVSFFRHPKNLGLIGNWNFCIQRARGHWVHILHQDDMILPGFYSHLREAAKAGQPIGAAFCRYLFIDEDGHWQFLSPIERRTPGVLEKWIERIAVMLSIQCSSMVVRRSVYEKLGGFCQEANSAADWEMWTRIAAHYPVWYEPHVLACFRSHPNSETSRLTRTAKDIADIRKSIEISESFLPKESARELSSRAKEHYAHYAIDKAHRMIAQGDWIAAVAYIKEGLNCSHSFKVIKSALRALNTGGVRWVRCMCAGTQGDYLENRGDLTVKGKPQNAMKFSVLINNYNYGSYIGAAIESVLAQTYQNFELIIVDDGSSDDSREIIAHYRDPRVRTIFQTNQGQGAALKVGFAAASGEAIALLDSDDEWHPNKLALCAEFLRERPDISLLQHGLDIIDGTGGFVRHQPLAHVGDYDPLPDYSRLRLDHPFYPSSCVVGYRNFFGRLKFEAQQWRFAADTPVIAGLSVLGNCHFLSERLTRYRIHEKNNFGQRMDIASLLKLKQRFYHSVDEHLSLMPGRHHLHRFEYSSAYQSYLVTCTPALSFAGLLSRLRYRLALICGR